MVVPFQKCHLLEQAPASLGRLGGIAGVLQMSIGGLLAAASVVLFRRGDAKLRFLMFWIYLAILPFGFIRLTEDWFALRYVYYSALPLCGLLAAAAIRLLSGRGRRRRTMVLMALVVYAVGTGTLLLAIERKLDQAARTPAHRAWLADLMAARDASAAAVTPDDVVGTEGKSP
jgi:hypothetical protein